MKVRETTVTGIDYGKKSYSGVVISDSNAKLITFNSGDVVSDYYFACVWASKNSVMPMNSSSVDHFPFDNKGFYWTHDLITRSTNGTQLKKVFGLCNWPAFGLTSRAMDVNQMRSAVELINKACGSKIEFKSFADKKPVYPFVVLAEPYQDVILPLIVQEKRQFALIGRCRGFFIKGA
jgi:hypothetical protein